MFCGRSTNATNWQTEAKCDYIRLIFIIENFGCNRDNLFFFFWRERTVYLLTTNKHSCLKCKYIKILQKDVHFCSVLGKGTAHNKRRSNLLIVTHRPLYTSRGWEGKVSHLNHSVYEHDNLDIADCNSVHLQNTNLACAWLIPKFVL